MAKQCNLSHVARKHLLGLSPVLAGGSHCGSSWCTRYWTACIWCNGVFFLALVVVSQERSSQTEYGSFSFFFERYLGHLCFFVFVCLDVLIIALVLFSSSGNSLHLWISIAKTHHLWMVSWTNIRTLLSGLMNIPSTRVFLWSDVLKAWKIFIKCHVSDTNDWTFAIPEFWPTKFNGAASKIFGNLTCRIPKAVIIGLTWQWLEGPFSFFGLFSKGKTTCPQQKTEVMFHENMITCSYLNMGVSKNKGTPKWLVYNGKPY